MNKENFENIQASIDENTEPLDTFVRALLDKKFKYLDEYMSQIDRLLVEGNDIPTKIIEDMLLNINSMLYWVGDGLETITLKESIARMIREEAYNNSYNNTDGTMGDKKSTATLNSQQEDLVRICYTNAMKLYQYKIDRASEMASALKKLLNRRVAELELSRTST